MQTFDQAVLEKAPATLTIGAIRESIERFRASDRTEQRNVADCIAYAGRIAALRGQSNGRAGESLFAGTKADTAVTTVVLLDSMKSQLEELRLRVWRSPDPPFVDYGGAVQWLETEALRAGRTKPTRSPKRLLADTVKLRRRWERRVGAPMVISLDRPVLLYLKLVGGEFVEQAVKLSKGSLLLDIKRFTIAAASSTGIEESAMVSWVLTGRCPGIARVSVAQTLESFPPKCPEVKIVIRSPRPQLRDLRRAYAIMKRKGRTGASVATAEDQLVLEAIGRLGKLPRRRVPGGLWHDVAREAGLTKTPGAIRMRVHRLIAQKRVPYEAIYQDP